MRYNDDQHRSQGSTGELELVLKVNGRFFGADKIQNEVCSLWLLERYCPDIPAPRIFAWSEDGETIICLSENRDGSRKGKLGHPGPSGGKKPGWVLMSRTGGESVSGLDLQEHEWAQVGRQVADLASSWRQSIPTQAYCGAICLQRGPTLGVTLSRSPDSDRPSLGVAGIIGDGLRFSDPVTDAIEFQRVKLIDKVQQLETQQVYSPNKLSLLPLIRDFVSSTLPKLELVRASTGNGNDGFVFTHYDLSPRNMLVSETDSGYKIVGVVDFEFAGFFPALEEFVNDYVDNGGDWPKAAYDAYLGRLGELGTPTPVKGIEKQVWQQAHWLGQLLENIAPWWLPGDKNEKELEEALGKSEEVVLGMLGLLKSMAEEEQ